MSNTVFMAVVERAQTADQQSGARGFRQHIRPEACPALGDLLLTESSVLVALQQQHHLVSGEPVMRGDRRGAGNARGRHTLRVRHALSVCEPRVRDQGADVTPPCEKRSAAAPRDVGGT